VSGAGPLTVTGSQPNDSITVTLTYTANSGYSGYGTLSYSFYAGNGTTSVTAALASGLSLTSFRSGSAISSTFVGTPGKATYYFQPLVGPKKPIPGCKNIATTVISPYTATCPWKPATHGPITITVVFTPTNSNYLSSSNSFIVNVSARSGTR
jgi:hypothetical protein